MASKLDYVNKHDTAQTQFPNQDTIKYKGLSLLGKSCTLGKPGKDMSRQEAYWL